MTYINTRDCFRTCWTSNIPRLHIIQNLASKKFYTPVSLRGVWCVDTNLWILIISLFLREAKPFRQYLVVFVCSAIDNLSPKIVALKLGFLWGLSSLLDPRCFCGSPWFPLEGFLSVDSCVFVDLSPNSPNSVAIRPARESCDTRSRSWGLTISCFLLST